MRYYHFTPYENAQSIAAQGLRRGKYDRVFLAADTAELKTQISYIYKLPQYTEMITVYEVDSEYLSADKTDYHKKGAVIVYSDDIPPTAFTNIWTVSVGIAMATDLTNDKGE